MLKNFIYGNIRDKKFTPLTSCPYDILDGFHCAIRHLDPEFEFCCDQSLGYEIWLLGIILKEGQNFKDV